MAQDQWSDSVRRNGEIILEALSEARDQMDDDVDAGNALAFAVAMCMSPDRVDDFIASLKTFAKAKRELTTQ
jgi:hypothetical protein